MKVYPRYRDVATGEEWTGECEIDPNGGDMAYIDYPDDYWDPPKRKLRDRAFDAVETVMGWVVDGLTAIEAWLTIAFTYLGEVFRVASRIAQAERDAEFRDVRDARGAFDAQIARMTDEINARGGRTWTAAPGHLDSDGYLGGRPIAAPLISTTMVAPVVGGPTAYLDWGQGSNNARPGPPPIPNDHARVACSPYLPSTGNAPETLRIAEEHLRFMVDAYPARGTAMRGEEMLDFVRRLRAEVEAGVEPRVERRFASLRRSMRFRGDP